MTGLTIRKTENCFCSFISLPTSLALVGEERPKSYWPGSTNNNRLSTSQELLKGTRQLHPIVVYLFGISLFQKCLGSKPTLIEPIYVFLNSCWIWKLIQDSLKQNQLIFANSRDVPCRILVLCNLRQSFVFFFPVFVYSDLQDFLMKHVYAN